MDSPRQRKLTKMPSECLRDIIAKVEQQVEMRHAGLRRAFRDMDADASGGVDADELRSKLVAWNLGLRPEELNALMDRMDTNGDDTISYSEFCAALNAKHYISPFGANDQYVTNHFITNGATGNGGVQVLLNDNIEALGPNRRPRPDYMVSSFKLSQPVTDPTGNQVDDYRAQLSDKIYTKFKALQKAFRALDLNKDGRLDKAELVSAVRAFNLPIPAQHIMAIASQCDTNKDGTIDYTEFAAALKRKDALGN